jgi:hypothetical protein
MLMNSQAVMTMHSWGSSDPIGWMAWKVGDSWRSCSKRFSVRSMRGSLS